MKDFLLVFRDTTNRPATAPTQEQIAAGMEAWRGWIDGLAQKGAYVGGHPLTAEGKHMKTRTEITDAPFAEGKEVLSGYVIVKAADFNEAVAISKDCPIFHTNGSLEVREINTMIM